MKKISLFFAMLFVVGMTMAQTTSNVALTDQNGNNNDALVKQIGATNDGTIHQNGNKNDAKVDQNGNDNVGVADQLNGNQNTGYVTQTGSTNEAYLEQGMVAGYIDATHTSSTMTANRNDASINQVGDDNSVGEVLQVGDDNSTSIDQLGNNNDAYSYQGWAYQFWGETYATSHLSSYNSNVTISQNGDGNSGRVWQYGGNNNNATINQQGNNNLVSLVQGWIYTDLNYDFYNIPIYNTQGNLASVDQYGNENHAKNIQLGNYNSFKLTQNGDGNSVGYSSSSVGLESSRNAYFTQDGNHNKFAGVYKNANNDVSFWESADAEQNNGSTLDIASYQRGDYNTIGLRQGKDDIALIQQNGNGNEILLWQSGANQNQATIMQTGDNNMSQVVQVQ